MTDPSTGCIFQVTAKTVGLLFIYLTSAIGGQLYLKQPNSFILICFVKMIMKQASVKDKNNSVFIKYCDKYLNVNENINIVHIETFVLYLVQSN